jgi:phosphotransferase system enzyme I (PtsI)
MSKRRSEIVLTGQPASRGLALGPLALLHSAPSAIRAAGTPAEEQAALRHAMTEATAQLLALAASADPAGADILEFQIALLDDEDLIEPILQGIAEGTPADHAWRAALEREIVAYRDGDDEVLAARAADLEDLCERVLRALSPDAVAQEQPVRNGQAILAAEDLTPSRFLELDWSHWQGALLKRGSAAGHVALLARARGTPLVVGLGDAFDHLRTGGLAVLDADQGRVIVDPAPATVAAAKARLAERVAEAATARGFLEHPARTRTGERVRVAINVDAPSLLDGLDPAHTDGVGLTRTEFLFQGTALPDEERQLAAYTRVLRWAGGRPVIIRTLDAGGDKPIAGLTLDGESNPFLGLRGLRLSLARPEVFRVQLRALARAAARGPLKVMAPMVTVPAELDAFRKLFREVADELLAKGVDAALPPLGMMVEVPAAALNAAAFEADFLSIGSNDLVQYVMAVARDNATIASLYDPRDPAVLELIGRVVEAGRAREVEVSLCGDMASDPALVPHLLALGVRRLSVAPAALGPVKAAVAAWPPA